MISPEQSSADLLKTLDTVEGLIQASNANLKNARDAARIEYNELNRYSAHFDKWVEKGSSETHKKFWREVFVRTKSLVERIQSHEIRGYDTDFEEMDLPKSVLTSAHKSWADYGSSSEEEDIDYLYKNVAATSSPSGLVIPIDLETVWPKGYAVILEASRTFSFDLILDPLSMARAGFKAKDALSTDRAVAIEAYNRLSVDDQRAVNILKSLFLFLKLEPDETLTSDPKFALSANFVLHFLLKTGNVEHDAKIAKSLKHEDGGKSIIIDRISSLFLTDRSVVTTLINTVEKVCRSLSRSVRSRPGGMSSDLRKLITEHCFTTPEGMLEKYYTRERKEVTSLVTEYDQKGKSRQVKKKRLVNGFRAPGLLLGEELLKPEERSRLKNFEHRFVMPKIARKAAESFIERDGKIEDLTAHIEKLVRDAYSATALVSTVIRQRKRAVRALATSGAGASKLTQSQWIAAAEETLASSTDMPEATFAGIERFLTDWNS